MFLSKRYILQIHRRYGNYQRGDEKPPGGILFLNLSCEPMDWGEGAACSRGGV